ncbi:hypothetical protein JCM8547_004095 [Rhodosporidiobolus lusitaniae]
MHHLLPRSSATRDLTRLPPGVEVHSTETVTEKKSTFQGHAVRVRSVEEAVEALQHVLAVKKVGKASHNILAYRLSSSSGKTEQGSDCNSEPPAGKNLLALLEKLDVEDVLLVVTRWYGGTPMGGQRFQVINTVGKMALEQGGFVKREEKREKKGKRR